jgi:hypothetical protein
MRWCGGAWTGWELPFDMRQLPSQQALQVLFTLRLASQPDQFDQRREDSHYYRPDHISPFPSGKTSLSFYLLVWVRSRFISHLYEVV